MAIFLYETRNKLTGKRYIGIHDGDVNDSYLGSGRYLCRAVKKYSAKNFERQVLVLCENREYACFLEECYVDEDFIADPNTYNVKLGGENAPLTKETRRRISEARKGKPLSEEHRRNISVGTKKALSRPEVKRKLGSGRRGVPIEQDQRDAIIKANIKRFSDPNERAKVGEHNRRTWADPEVRKRRSRGISKAVRGKKRKPLSKAHKEAIRTGHIRRHKRLKEEQL